MDEVPENEDELVPYHIKLTAPMKEVFKRVKLLIGQYVLLTEDEELELQEIISKELKPH